jgi:hypothetical protein
MKERNNTARSPCGPSPQENARCACVPLSGDWAWLALFLIKGGGGSGAIGCTAAPVETVNRKISSPQREKLEKSVKMR